MRILAALALLALSGCDETTAPPPVTPDPDPPGETPPPYSGTWTLVSLGADQLPAVLYTNVSGGMTAWLIHETLVVGDSLSFTSAIEYRYNDGLVDPDTTVYSTGYEVVDSTRIRMQEVEWEDCDRRLYLVVQAQQLVQTVEQDSQDCPAIKLRAFERTD